jgi:hypothetical protein
MSAVVHEIGDVHEEDPKAIVQLGVEVKAPRVTMRVLIADAAGASIPLPQITRCV